MGVALADEIRQVATEVMQKTGKVLEVGVAFLETGDLVTSQPLMTDLKTLERSSLDVGFDNSLF